MREVDGIVQGEERHAGPEPHRLREGQGLGNEQVGGGRVLPPLRQVLAHPGFVKAEPIGEDDLIDVAVVAVRERAVGRVKRHHEQAELHGGSSVDLPADNGTPVAAP